MATVFKPPTKPILGNKPSVFLAGTIDNGKAEDWQVRVELCLQDLDIVILNPRRDEWDASWEQRIDYAPFRQQVEWELDGLESASVILMYFAPGSQSPISLLEFGLWAASNKLIVVSPFGFWRRGNIEVVTHRYRIPLFENLEDGLAALRSRLNEENIVEE